MVLQRRTTRPKADKLLTRAFGKNCPSSVFVFGADRGARAMSKAANVVRFPKFLAPPDARPIGREKTVHVFPETGGWCCHEYDEGGGFCLISNATKDDAIRAAVDFVKGFNAEMILSNEPWDVK
jgi:hypothetical protein